MVVNDPDLKALVLKEATAAVEDGDEMKLLVVDQPAATPWQWWVARAREPSTYQGLALLAGAVSQYFYGDTLIGEKALQIALAVAGLISVGKREAVSGRDY